MRALFEQYPELGRNLACAPLARLPTPVTRRVWPDHNRTSVWIKRDDLCSPLYGGNKVRKLEFLLGRALHENRNAVLTFGVTGSNHVLATARCARQVGLHCIAILSHQPATSYLAQNLAAVIRSGAEPCSYPKYNDKVMGAVGEMRRAKKNTGVYPLIIPPGGSSATGCVGFVNAAFELKQQIGEGQLPEPDHLYLALGTAGSVAGLGLGLVAAGLKSRIVAVRVAYESVANIGAIETLWRRTVMRLQRHDHSFPALDFDRDRFLIRDQYLGSGYARGTPEGQAAIRIGRRLGLKLEGTYTGKTLAAMIDDLRSPAGIGNVLFWDTANSRPLAPASGINLDSLDPELKACFSTT